MLLRLAYQRPKSDQRYIQQSRLWIFFPSQPEFSLSRLQLPMKSPVAILLPVMILGILILLPPED